MAPARHSQFFQCNLSLHNKLHRRLVKRHARSVCLRIDYLMSGVMSCGSTYYHVAEQYSVMQRRFTSMSSLSCNHPRRPHDVMVLIAMPPSNHSPVLHIVVIDSNHVENCLPILATKLDYWGL